MGFAAAVGDRQRAIGLVAAAGEPLGHIAHQITQIQGWKGQGKKLGRIFVNFALPFLQDDIVQIGGEDG